MSEQARAARAAMKDKARRMAEGTNAKVDASSWNPAQTFEADEKTGAKPKSARAYKRGGTVHGEHAKHHAGKRPRKAVGGPMNMDPRMGAAAMMARGNAAANVPTQMMNFSGVKKSPLNPFKKGGKTEHSDEKEDRKLIDKMVKPSARTGKKYGGDLDEADGTRRTGGREARKHGGAAEHPEGCACKMCNGGRMARKSGGRAKSGKTNINIIIAGKDKDQQPQMMPPSGPVHPPMGPPPGAGGPPPSMPPMPMGAGPMPSAGGPPGMPQGIPPMPMGRKHGGRTYPIKDGSGGGEGRLQKIKSYGLKPPK